MCKCGGAVYTLTHLRASSGGNKVRHDAVSKVHELVFGLNQLLGAAHHHVALTLIGAVLAHEHVRIPHSIVLLRIKPNFLTIDRPSTFLLFPFDTRVSRRNIMLHTRKDVS